MLNSLIIKNLILIEEEEISFEKGLTVITGETGAGKTALIQAISLILGQKADSSKVRKNSDKAFVLGSFSLEPSEELMAIFEEAGLNFDAKEELILKREISSSGKSRSFVGTQMVPAAFLQKIAPYLVEFVGQHAAFSLKSVQVQQEILDLFAGIDLIPFQKAWNEEKSIAKELLYLQEEKAQSEKRKLLLQGQIEELLEANLKPDEDEEALFEEYTLLANSQKLIGESLLAQEKIGDARSNSLEMQHCLREIEKYTSDLQETQNLAKETLLLFEEINLDLQSLQAKLEGDPNRLTFLEERLKVLDRLRKKYGPSPLNYLEELQRELKSLDTLEEREAQLEKDYREAQLKTQNLCKELSSLRISQALSLEKRLTSALRDLNMPNADLKMIVKKAERTKNGENQIFFMLKANSGQEFLPIQESSSGGELSRLIFAIKTTLAEKNQPKTIIFDEIDANVGGETATKMGMQIKNLAKKRQVLCITHFPQMARQGDHHLCVYKSEKNGMTQGQIKPLTNSEKEMELLRMLGGAKVFTQEQQPL